ncbi:NAD(P)H-dependent glycerol-3-phosphate dehydrogenase [candidate division WOR-3 bacterium]|uniref:Glycerol-3-phosphate dehydrogenase [NAD(P)+] n=1 Tax=candidate division WOR-3 bacterium TaxID=2052148 RepID=A0A9D5K783_UNCW3|nr:NAD(P)H-dependent glycerol-3-phosphate dehydrogenase [candidate division WOR-3 bacterium]MBD3363616.1 NAD(P)H-dependent glycerol-3-phosphate dehydrogenase [candidate division WOR-3 bacterium]
MRLFDTVRSSQQYLSSGYGQGETFESMGKDMETGKLKIGFLGAGAWGTTMGIKLWQAGHKVSLWEISRIKVEKLSHTRRLPGVLPGILLPRGLSYTSDMKEAVYGIGLLVLAVPCQALRSTLKSLSRVIKDKIPTPGSVVSLIKGLESKTGLRPSQVWEEFFPKVPVTVVSGPSIAIEVLKGQPTAMVAAGKDPKKVRLVQHTLSEDNVRVYRSDDPVGVELAGALKNIIAIASGIAEGLGMGTNARAALLARGQAEITRLGQKLGARPRTFAGLAGWGDLVTTAWNPSSRNHRVGLGVARGKVLQAILEELGMVAEGVETCKIARKLGKMYNVEMPITESVYRVLFRKSNPGKELERLVSRPLKNEVW